MKLITTFLLSLLLTSSWSFAAGPKVLQESCNFFDMSRHRNIPVEIYFSKPSQDVMRRGTGKLPVVIINHGYTVKNTEYSFISEALAKKGYYVVSIQHDLKTDSETLPKYDPMASQSDIAIRKPLWERGTQNILFVIGELKKTNPNLNLKKVILIGHSNGGDIVLFFLLLHPEIVSKIISLDSLRMPFPKNGSIPILTLRSYHDQQPNVGVLPKMGSKSGVAIIVLNDAKHVDMCDRGPQKVKEEILAQVAKFL